MGGVGNPGGKKGQAERGKEALVLPCGGAVVSPWVRSHGIMLTNSPKRSVVPLFALSYR